MSFAARHYGLYSDKMQALSAGADCTILLQAPEPSDS
jgi:hypothetical protein